MARSESQREITILLVEDDPGRRKSVLEFIQREYGEKSLGVGSAEEVDDLFDDLEGSGEPFEPDLAILDCKILRTKESIHDTLRAGASAYAVLLREEIPVVALTSLSKQEILTREPYRSDPPIEVLAKTVNTSATDEGEQRWVAVDEAVKAFLAWRESGNR